MALRLPQPIAPTPPHLATPRIRAREWRWVTLLGGLLLLITLVPVLIAAIDAARKAADALNFFQRWGVGQRDEFLRANAVDFVLTGDPAAVTRLEYDPQLRVVDRQDGWALFQVTR